MKKSNKQQRQASAEIAQLVDVLHSATLENLKNEQEDWQNYLSCQAQIERIVKAQQPSGWRPAQSNNNLERLEKAAALYEWAAKKGILHEKVRIADFPNYELGLQATCHIAKGQQLFSVPRTCMLSEETVPEESRSDCLGSTSHFKLVYALLIEVLKTKSDWLPYLNMLPAKYNTIFYWTPEEMSELRGTHAFADAVHQYRVVLRQYCYLHKCINAHKLSKQSPKGFPLLRKQLSFDLFRWAVSTVMTRQNLIPRLETTNNASTNSDKISVLIPLWDMANHQDGVVSSFYNQQTAVMESDAQKDFAENEQVYIYYGDRSNAAMLVHNGFVDAKKQKDYIIIQLGLNPADPLYSKRMQLLKRLMAQTNSMTLRVLPAPIFISGELLAFVRIFKMNETQLEHWICSDRSLDLLHIDCGLDTELNSMTWKFLEMRLFLLLKKLPSSKEKDEEKLKDTELSAAMQMILQYRLIERRLLQDAKDYCSQHVNA